jgi:hypothetical protein
VAVAGALVAWPQLHGLASAGPAAAALDQTMTHPVELGHISGGATGLAYSVNSSEYPRIVEQAAPRRPASALRPAAAPAPHLSLSTSASPASQVSPASAPSQQPAAAAGGGTSLSCTGTAGMLPENYAAIVAFLTAHGYTGLAAAGIAGNIYQESKGDPESAGSGGGGLIGWTPLPAGFVTGNPAADLQTQLEALLTFNQQWAQFIPALNAATSATQAADIYMDDFERPGLPEAGNREAAADAVAAACGLGG